MLSPACIQDVRRLVARNLAELGADRAALSCLQPVALVDEDRLVGLAFQADGFSARWSTSGLVEFSNSQGDILRRVRMPGTVQPAPRAA